jgi:hypothetical protein
MGESRGKFFESLIVRINTLPQHHLNSAIEARVSKRKVKKVQVNVERKGQQRQR